MQGLEVSSLEYHGRACLTSPWICRLPRLLELFEDIGAGVYRDGPIPQEMKEASKSH